MKRKGIFFYMFILTLAFCFLPNKVLAASPPATLTVDGVLVGTYGSVQEAVDAVTTTTGSNFVIEIAEGTVTDPLNIIQQPNKNVVIMPQPEASVTFTNTINIDGNGNLSNPETLLIQGLTFDLTSGSPAEAIYFNLIPPDRPGFSYAHNVTINGCEFRGVFDATVAVQSVTGGTRNISIMNSTATDMHSLAQLKAVSGYAFIQNNTLSNSSEGVNFYGPGNLVIDSNRFDVTGYAVRSGQGSGTITNAGSVTINNSILNSNSLDRGTVVLRGDSTNNINIVHSNITNANPNGPSIQNINDASINSYNIDIVESNITGLIAGINPTTVNYIDDPNVENGPVSVLDIPDNGSDIFFVVIIILFLLLIASCILTIIKCKPYHPCRKRPKHCR
ncbi:MAG: hypothetical protein GX323_10745 [Clostridiales bacterium]|nr:hypothetical protein [Clostridiales bacterium]